MVPAEFATLFASYEAPVYTGPRHAWVKRVVDGDTIATMISTGFTQWADERVRLVGVNTPEARGVESPAGKFVTKELQKLLPTGPDAGQCVVDSQKFRRDKYGRAVVVLWKGEICINRWLLEMGFAWPCDKSGDIIGLRDISRLQGIPSGLRQQVIEAKGAAG